MVVGGKAIEGTLSKPTQVGKIRRGRRSGGARNATATARAATAVAVARAQPPPLSPPEEFGEDEQEEVFVTESEKYDVIGDGSVVIVMWKGMSFDGGKGMMVEFETRAATQEEQEVQWQSPMQQQHDQQQHGGVWAESSYGGRAGGTTAVPYAAATGSAAASAAADATVAGTGTACLAATSPRWIRKRLFRQKGGASGG